jgi:hypothetical protein
MFDDNKIIFGNAKFIIIKVFEMSKSKQITKKGKIQKLVSLCYRFKPKEPIKEAIYIYCQNLITFIKQTPKVDFEK